MSRGTPARPSGRLAIVLAPIAILLAAAPPSGPGRAAPWWEARVAITVRGGYGVKAPTASFTGEYTYGARWAGILERDGPDVLLYHARSEEREWGVREKAVRPEGTAVLTEKDAAGRPALRVHYVLRLDGDLVFDISVGGLQVPLGPCPDRVDLDLPASREHGGAAAGGYDDFVTAGTNRIALGADGMEKKTVEKPFAWEWKRERWVAAATGTTVRLAGAHRVSGTITLIRHD
ncbi:MAG TPA: hypothetical protein VMS75_00400 [Terriglobales bacterium]|nr:hypothetical protein [Terriglobales bacterium]